MSEYFLTKLFLIILDYTRCISVFVSRCQGNAAVPNSMYYAQSVSTFGKEIQCASECMTDLVWLSYFFRDIRGGTSNCIHVPNIYDCSGLEGGDYRYKTKVSQFIHMLCLFDIFGLFLFIILLYIKWILGLKS